jgi:hypothetical protein
LVVAFPEGEVRNNSQICKFEVFSSTDQEDIMRRSYAGYAISLLVFLFTLSVFTNVSYCEQGANITRGVEAFENTPAVLDKANPQVQAVAAVQNRHTPWLMARPEVVGTAIGLTDAGEPAILVFTKRTVDGIIPGKLDGIPVVVKVTGKFLAMPRPPDKGPPGKSGGKKHNVDPRGRFTRPVPIGVSTGNEVECSAGTLGARVRRGSEVFALSNNHVYSLENRAPIGSRVLQPGRYDTGCAFDPQTVIGTLSEFVPIVFSITYDNRVDAAIARTMANAVGNATPADGYGIPRSTAVRAALGDRVEKYGRTTSLTKGTITGLNATVNVSYGSGVARFVGQIIVSSSKKPFIKTGDSGSLLVTDPRRNPVGLLFAGSSSGKTAVANPIGEVLGSFDVTIDGE